MKTSNPHTPLCVGLGLLRLSIPGAASLVLGGLLLMARFAHAAPITGQVVTTEGEPVAGCTVSMAAQGVAGSTDAGGRFRLKNVVSRDAGRMHEVPRLVGNRLFFSTSGRKPVRIHIHTLSGRLVRSVSFEEEVAGIYRINPRGCLPPTAGRALFVLQVVTPNVTGRFKLSNLAGQRSAPGLTLVKRFNTPAHSANAGDDDVTVSCPDCEPKTVKLPGNSNNLGKIRVTGTAEALEHSAHDIIFTVRRPVRDRHYYPIFGNIWTSENNYVWRAPGFGRLCRLSRQTGEVTVLLEDNEGHIRDPHVHYSGSKILFSWRKGGTNYYHLWEINADGTGLKQITDGPWDDIEPMYTPDDDIIFVSSRCKRWVPCYIVQVGTLHRCNGDGTGIRTLSANVEWDNAPCMLDNGLVMYTRWEYVDRGEQGWHHLWVMFPDGTEQRAYYGNMHGGGTFIDARPIPGSSKIAMIHAQHTSVERGGHVSIVDPGYGPDALEAETVIAEGEVHGGFYRDVFPLSEDEFLVVDTTGLLTMNSSGSTRELYRLSSDLDGAWIHEPRVLKSRDREPVLASKVDLNQPRGELVLQDVYIGRNMEGVNRGDIKKLLVFEILPTATAVERGGAFPVTRSASWFIKRQLGTIPVEADGSANMKLPANRALQFVALDENNRSVKWMQSFTTVMPGEKTACIGCHEKRTMAPPAMPARAALAHPAVAPTLVPGVPEIFDYPRDIQPILDKNCGECHGADSCKGGVLLTGDWSDHFTHGYLMLWEKQQLLGIPSNWHDKKFGKSNWPPRALGSSACELMDKLTGAHHDVVASPEDLLTISTWLEASATHTGTYAGEGRRIRFRGAKDLPAVKAGYEAMERRCGPCHGYPYGDKNPRACPETPDAGVNVWWGAQIPLLLRGPFFYNLTRPGKSAALMAPLAQSAGGWQRCGEPVFQSTDDPDYQKILRLVEAFKTYAEEQKAWGTAGFYPHEAYIRVMKRYDVLPEGFSYGDPIDVYETDRKYWDAFIYRPDGVPVSVIRR